MSKRILNPDFDPLATLQGLARNQESMAQNINEIVRAVNNQAELIKNINARLAQIEKAQHESTLIHNPEASLSGVHGTGSRGSVRPNPQRDN